MEESEKETRPRVYKGETTTAEKLRPGAIVQSMPEARKAYRLPLFMVVESITPYTSKDNLLYYADPRALFQRRTAIIPKGVELNVLTGRMGKELEAELKAHKRSRIRDWVRAPGMSLGSDPEVFVTTKDNKGVETIIPAFTFLPGKKKPLTLSKEVDPSGAYKGNTAYWDGFQAEFTTNPTTCLQYQTEELRRSMLMLHQAVKKHNSKADLSISSVLPVPDGALETGKDEHVEFGCMPSLNAYGLEGDKTPGRQVALRFAGGHLHMGIGNEKVYNNEQVARIAKAMDKILGVACVSLFEGYDIPIRRQYYGLPGEYRRPAHGIEYRTLSNAWLIHPTVTNLVVEIARCAIGFGCSGMEECWNSPEEETIEAITKSDVALARQILERNRMVFESVVDQRGLAGSTAQVYAFVMGGMEGKLKNPRSIALNWDLDDNRTRLYDSYGKVRNWRGYVDMSSNNSKFKLD